MKNSEQICFSYLRNDQNLLSDGKIPYERRFGQSRKGPIIPFGSLVEYITLSLRKTVKNGRIKTLGGDQDLRTSTLIRERPIRGESHVDFLGEPEGSLPPPYDSFPDAGEAMNDVWSTSGNFIYRHHVEPRVQLYSPREEPFPVPLEHIDVSRTTHTNLVVKQERRIDDYWNIDVSKDFSDSWTGFTQFTLLEEKPLNGYTWSGVRLTRKQLTSRPDYSWPELWTKLGRNAQLKERQKWSHEKRKLDNARK